MSYEYGDGRANTARPSKLMNTTKVNQLEDFTIRVPLDGDQVVTNFGQAPVDNLDTSMRAAGARGPTEISDPVARERISHFDHERIPERVVHARGAAAHGVFQLHTSISEYTFAKIFTEVGKDIPLFTRFSTVLGSSGAAETAREVRGFASKFYTEQGIYDCVGNNIPVFFVQDGIKFVDLIHAGKPEPQIGLPQAQTAHDSFWDFISLTPESTAMVAWALSDYTIPRSYRMMKGFGVNTYVLINSKGERTFVKYHWKPHQGTHSLVWDEALKLSGQDPDFLRRDLAEAIESKSYPKWEFGVQLISEELEETLEFDILDCTKLVTEDIAPIKWIGTMTLNKNPTNYFAETEQVAFCTSNILPGMDYSNDPMLQLRNFSYHDTQISRLGGINFPSLPINRSICPFVTLSRDGVSSHRIPAGPHYYPNRFTTPNVGTEHGKGQNYATSEEAIKEATKVNENVLNQAHVKEEGIRGKLRPARFAEHVNQAQLFYNSLAPVEQKHMIDAAKFELGKVDDEIIQQRMMTRFNEIDHDFAVSIAEGFGIEVPAPKKANDGKKSLGGQQPFSMLSTENIFSAISRKVGIIVLDGFDSSQVTPLVASLTAMGIIPQLIGSRKGLAYPAGVKIGDKSAFGLQRTDFTGETCRSTHFDGIFLPSGDERYETNLNQGGMIHFVREAYGHYKTIGALGISVGFVMHKCLGGITEIKADASTTFTSNLGMVMGPNVVDGDSSLFSKLTKGIKDGATYGSAFVDALAAHRHWGRDVSTVAF